MIFIIFFGLIAAVFIGLNIWDNSNINKIETYFKAQQCQTVSYVSGQYRGVCANKVIVIRNGFRVDIENPEKLIHYKDIRDLKKTDMSLVIKTQDDSTSLEFKETKELEKFYNEIQNRIQN